MKAIIHMIINNFLFLFVIIPSLLSANIADAWWNNDWHYRAELNINSAVINQTGKMDIDFSALGLPSALDENSIRIVKSDGTTLLTKQEFTDVLYNNATDTLNNDRGEVKFIIENGGTVRYYVYYDTTANGSKTALASSYGINGNFEHSAGTTPSNWSTGQANIGSNAPNNEVHPTGGEGTTVSVTNTGGANETINTNNVSHTGSAFHIHGYRDRSESGGNREQTWIEKTFTVPSSSTGNMTYWLRVQGWDSVDYDFIRVSINGTTINHINLNIADSDITVNNNEYGESSAYSTYADSAWTRARLNLSVYAGQTITVRIMQQTLNDNGYKMWQQLDDLEWSIKAVSLGTQETLPNMSIIKRSCVTSDSVNNITRPKRIPGATIRYAFQVSNTGSIAAKNVLVDDTLNSSFDYNTIKNLQIQNGLCDCTGVASASNNGANGTGNGVNPIKLDFGTVAGGSVANPTRECGYFEVNIK